MGEISAPAADDMRACPRCAETIKRAAVVCRFCGAELASRARDFRPPQARAQGPGCFVIGLSFIGLIIATAIGSSIFFPPAKRVYSAAERAAGLHCLDPVIGWNEAVYFSVKHSLNDPKSMDHDRTLIGPVDANGLNAFTMIYRAKNAFGGVVVQTVSGHLRNDTCGIADWKPN